MQVIDNVAVGLIPREEFAARQWFTARPRWYYHRPGRPRASRMREGFYSLIDPNLRQACLMLHREGLATLPSCEGHFHERRYFAEVWEQLQRERDEIRGVGLVLEDSETSAKVLFRRRSYDLPWSGFEAFWSDVSAMQGGGYLGIEIGPGHRHIARELKRHPLRETAASIALQRPAPGSWIAAIYVDPRTPEEGVAQWSRISGYLHHLLRIPAHHMTISLPRQ